MHARIRSRVRSEPFVGLAVLVFASGLLVGVLAGHVRSGPRDTVIGRDQGVAPLAGESAGAATDTGATDAGASSGTAIGGGTAAPGASSATGGAGSPEATAVAGHPAVAVRGVTDTSIKLGIACIDLGAFKAVPQFDIGDNQAQFTSVLEGWKRAGMLPVNGRNIELVQRCFKALSAEDQRATAVELVNDKKVFVVGAVTTFQDGSEIVAQELKTPIVSVSPMLASNYQRDAPNLFTIQQEMTVAARNFVHWMKDQNLIGKKVGIYYLNDSYQPTAVHAMQDELAKLGNTNSVSVATDQLLGGPSDAVAVQRFRSEGVEVVALLTSPAGFIQAAAGQRYKPQYVQTDFAGPYVNNGEASTYDANNFDGGLAMTSTRTAELRFGTVAKQTQDCLDNYFKTTGRRIDADSHEAEWNALTNACDIMNALYQAISKAGRNLTPQSFVQALTTVNYEGAQYGNIGFSPTKHDGGTTFRTVVWKIGCKCWNIVPPPAFRPFFVQ